MPKVIWLIILVALVNGNEVANQADWLVDNVSHSEGHTADFKISHLLKVEVEGIGNDPKTSKEVLNETITILKQLHNEVSTLKKQISEITNSQASDCFVESRILEGKSYPIGVNYRRVCHPNTLSEEADGTKKGYPTSCKEILRKGNNVSGFYKIQPKQLDKPLTVLCDMETREGGWTHIQKRYDGSVDFFLGWREYKFGFGDLGSEFWLGLENIYRMTGFEAYELLVEIVDRENKVAHAHYKHFAIGAEPEGYPLNTLSGFSGDAGDSMTVHIGAKFSTKDLDRDTCGDCNCATTRGAWWYRSCYKSNLNSIYINANLPNQLLYGGLQWETFGPWNYCHAKSRMLIRPVG